MWGDGGSRGRSLFHHRGVAGLNIRLKHGSSLPSVWLGEVLWGLLDLMKHCTENLPCWISVKSHHWHGGWNIMLYFPVKWILCTSAKIWKLATVAICSDVRRRAEWQAHPPGHVSISLVSNNRPSVANLASFLLHLATFQTKYWCPEVRLGNYCDQQENCNLLTSKNFVNPICNFIFLVLYNIFDLLNTLTALSWLLFMCNSAVKVQFKFCGKTFKKTSSCTLNPVGMT